VKEKIACPSDRIASVLKTVRQEFANFQLDTRDGVKVVFPDGWLLVRGSNTEPIVRIVAEARSEARARELVNSTVKLVQ
jgi:phosphomannomutase/phosphoglucomutase